MRITNRHDISLPLAVWLLHDEYDYVNEPNYISATSLLKPVKQLLLARRISRETQEVDLGDLVARAMGNALHDSIEKAWRRSAPTAMKLLGYPDHITGNIVINPTTEEIENNPNIIPVWFEQRSIKEYGGYKIGGKFDTVLEGRLFDNKSTSVWSYLKGNKNEDYALQGSIYRWLNQNLITSDHIYIQFIFTDWQRHEAKRNPDYPQTKVKEHPVPLLSIADTERFISSRLAEIERYRDADESEMPECSDKDLWRSDPQYKYYSDPTKMEGRSSKNFDNMADAQAYMASKGGKGAVKTVPGQVKACEYCPAFEICRQKDRYFVGSI